MFNIQTYRDKVWRKIVYSSELVTVWLFFEACVNLMTTKPFFCFTPLQYGKRIMRFVQYQAPCWAILLIRVTTLSKEQVNRESLLTRTGVISGQPRPLFVYRVFWRLAQISHHYWPWLKVMTTVAGSVLTIADAVTQILHARLKATACLCTCRM